MARRAMDQNRTHSLEEVRIRALGVIRKGWTIAQAKVPELARMELEPETDQDRVIVSIGIKRTDDTKLTIGIDIDRAGDFQAEFPGEVVKGGNVFRDDCEESLASVIFKATTVRNHPAKHS
jgi:hypothetical protein